MYHVKRCNVLPYRLGANKFLLFLILFFVPDSLQDGTLKATLLMLEQKERKLRAQMRANLLEHQQQQPPHPQQQELTIDGSYSFSNPIHGQGGFGCVWYLVHQSRSVFRIARHLFYISCQEKSTRNTSCACMRSQQLRFIRTKTILSCWTAVVFRKRGTTAA